jgi:hypothetical protein
LVNVDHPARILGPTEFRSLGQGARATLIALPAIKTSLNQQPRYRLRPRREIGNRTILNRVTASLTQGS